MEGAVREEVKMRSSLLARACGCRVRFKEKTCLDFVIFYYLHLTSTSIPHVARTDIHPRP